MEQFNHVLARFMEAANERECLSKLECQVKNLSADLQQAWVQNAAERELLVGVKTKLVLQKMGPNNVF